MIITILRRYDMNGAWTHDEEARIGLVTREELKFSMYRIHQVINVNDMAAELSQLREANEYLELECEDLTEKNRLLTLRTQNDGKESD